ncbi:MAG: hypothetical protein IPH88_12075 [Bacteroidales bacterium]|nr:hypothetical protein [Bacteroidales bacterium]
MADRIISRWHRNSIETTTAIPVSFAGSNITYDFSTAAGQAFGSNQKLIGGKYLIYAGDLNQDGIVDSGDMMGVDNGSSNFLTGYIVIDANGDGLIDSGDMIVVDNNASTFIGSVTP